MSKVLNEFALQLERVEQAESRGILRRRQIDSLGRLAHEYARSANPNDPILAAMQLEIGKRHRTTPIIKVPGSPYWAIEALDGNRWVRVFDGISAFPTARIKAYKFGMANDVRTRVVPGDPPGGSAVQRRPRVLEAHGYEASDDIPGLPPRR